MSRISSTLTAFWVGLNLLLPLPLASAETLSDIDLEIQANRTIKIDLGVYDAYNIYEGVTDSRLDRKILILRDAGVNTRFFQKGDGATDYTNFYSFTSLNGVTDTELGLVTTDSTFRLYRRGNSGYQEAMGYLGSWWGDQYRGIEESRDEQAILAAWGSDLQRIYVIDVPVGYTLVAGTAAPMEKNGEYRNGGAYQYYYRGALTNWLVYALYAPDYLKSYPGAITSAQKAGRSIATDLSDHLNQTRHAAPHNQKDNFWLRSFGGDLDYNENDGSSVNSQTTGMSIGWQRMISGQNSADHSRSYLGLMFGQGINLQKYETSDVKNDSQATVGGIYGLYIHAPESLISWYGSCSLLYGGLSLHNTVPGELGYGLDQEYDGNIFVMTAENGITFRQDNGWSLEPQLQLSYTKIEQSDFNDNLGALVSLKQGDSFRGRLGLEVRKTLRNTYYKKISVWTKLSYIFDFSDGNEVSVAGDLAISELDQNSYGLAVGTNLEFNHSWSLTGLIEEVFDGERGLQGNLALNYSW